MNFLLWRILRNDQKNLKNLGNILKWSTKKRADQGIHLFQNCLKPKILYLRSRRPEAAPKACQMKDFGLQAILEKMNSLNTPLFNGPF